MNTTNKAIIEVKIVITLCMEDMNENMLDNIATELRDDFDEDFLLGVHGVWIPEDLMDAPGLSIKASKTINWG